MGQKNTVATLGIELEMLTGPALRNVAEFGAGIDKLAADTIRDAAKAEAAIQAIGNVSAPVAGMKGVAESVKEVTRVAAEAAGGVREVTTTSREAATAARERAQAEREVGKAIREAAGAARERNQINSAVESMIRQLDREAVAIGKTKDELRDAKVEALALAAASEKIGNTDGADRLLTAARQRVAAAEAEAEARQREADAATHAVGVEAAANRNAAAGYAAFEAAARQGLAAMKEREAAIERAARSERDLAEATRATNSRLAERAQLDMALEQHTGLGRMSATDAGATYSALAARAEEEEARAASIAATATKRLADEHERLSAAVRGSHDAQMADAVAAERLRETTDSVYAATKRVNAELEESTRLYHAGATAPAEYARQQQVLKARLTETAVAEEVAAKATGLNRNQIIIAQSAFLRFGDAVISGMNPLKAFALEAHKGVEVMSADTGGFAGGLTKVAGLALSVAGPLAVAGVAFERWHQQLNDRAGLDAYAKQLGLTEKQIKSLGGATVTVGDMLKGIWKTIVDDLNSEFGGRGKRLIDYLFAPTDAKQVEGFIASIYGAFVGSYHAIIETWRQFPAAFADLIVQGVNKGIEGIQWLVNKSIDAANALGLNLGHVDLGQVKNNFAGTAHAVGDTFASEVKKATAQAQGSIDRFIDTSGRNAIQAARDRLKDGAKDDKPDKADKHAEQLAREAEAIEAQIKNLYKLADAYGVSGAAALIAEAREKAESHAIKERGDIEAAVDRQVRLAIAQRVADAAKVTAGMVQQASAQAQVNAMVAAGLVPAAAAAGLVKDHLVDLPLIAAAQAAQQRADEAAAAHDVQRQTEMAAAAKMATDQLEAQRAVRAALRREEAVAKFNDTTAAGADQLAQLREEARLIGATDAARVRALATLRATQEANRMVADGLDPDRAAAYVAQQVALADAQERLTAAQQRFNNLLPDSEDAVKRYAAAFGDAFGSIGASIAAVTAALIDHGAEQRKITKARDEDLARAGHNEAAAAVAQIRYARASANNQIGAYADITGAAKGFFNEHSKIYKALQTAETVFRAVQLALSIQKMVQDAAETASTVANASIRATAEGTEGIASQAKLPFPANIAAMAATAAALVGIGVGLLGGIGGGHNNLPKANDGTGTVLGDASAKSESIKNAIDALKSVDDATLVVSHGMLASLRSIENNIGGLASLLVRTGNINADDQVSAGFKTSTIGSVLSKIPLIGGFLGSLFGTKTTVVGSGLYGGDQSVGDILSGGYDLQTYSDIQKKKKFLGLTTSTKYSTVYGQADDSIDDQFTLVLRSFYEAISKAAPQLGQATSDVEQRLNSFVFSVGKIDIQGKTGTEIQEELENVLGAAADKMAQAAVPGLEKFQKVGEGYFETLVRVATTTEQVDANFQKLGVTTGSLGIDVDMAIAGLFDSVSDFTDAAQSYFEAYYSEAEQAAAKTAQLGKVFTSLGVAMPDTLAGFRNLVEAQDLTTAAGQETYATLLQIAPAFADLKKALDGAKSAADILSERENLQQKLLELTGDTAALRAAEIAKLDPSNRALQEQIYAIQDAQDAAKAADELRQAWQSVGDSIMDEVNRIRGLTDASSGGSFVTLLGQFNAANSAARAGDMDVAKTLPQLSKSLLDAAALAATSRQELDRVQAQTAASLEATFAAIGGLTSDGTTTSSDTSTMLATAAAAQAAASTTSQNDDMLAELRALREEVAGLRGDTNSGNAAIVSPISRVARTLDAVTAASGGEAVTVAGLAA